MLGNQRLLLQFAIKKPTIPKTVRMTRKRRVSSRIATVRSASKTSVACRRSVARSMSTIASPSHRTLLRAATRSLKRLPSSATPTTSTLPLPLSLSQLPVCRRAAFPQEAYGGRQSQTRSFPFSPSPTPSSTTKPSKPSTTENARQT